MKMSIMMLVCLGCVAIGAEPVTLPLDLGTFKTLDNKVYDEAKVVGSDAVGVKIMHAGGTARISFDRLPRDLVAKFQVDPGAAAEQLKKEAAEGAAHEREMNLAAKNEDKPGEGAKKAGEKTPEEEDEELLSAEELPEVSKVAAAERIRMLEAYIVRVEKELVEMEKAVQRKIARAGRVADNGGYDVNHDFDRGVSTYAKNRSSINRSQFIMKSAVKQREQIEEARKRADAARVEIAKLR